jgi:hypothetical protein
MESVIEKTKMVISISTNDNKEHITQLLNKNTDLFIERLNLIIPKGNEDRLGLSAPTVRRARTLPFVRLSFAY